MDANEQLRRQLAVLRQEFLNVHARNMRAFEAGDLEAAKQATLLERALVERLGELSGVTTRAAKPPEAN